MNRNASLYAKILVSILHHAKTALEIHREVGCTRMNVMLALRAMHGPVVHVESYAPGTGRPAMWRTGAKADAPRPRGNRGLGYWAQGGDRIAFVVLLRTLMSGPYRQLELERATGLSHGAVRRQLRTLKAAGLIRIGAWDKPSGVGNPAAYWEWAPGQSSVPKPRALTRTEARRRWYRAAKQRARDQKIHTALAGNAEVYALRA